jgi:antitoxin HigA-1
LPMRTFSIPTKRRPNTPGEVLDEDFRKPLGLTQQALADALGIDRVRLNGILRGRRRVTPDTAARLARVLGTSAEWWLNMQMVVDLYEVYKTSLGAEIKKLRPVSRRAS